MPKAERCPTGIQGLDELINGGLPRGRCTLLTGTCGTGKTTLAVQFLYNGALEYKETGILVTLEQGAEEIRNDMSAFGMDLQKLEDSGKLIILDTSLSKLGLKDFVMEVPVMPKKSFSILPGEFNLEKITKIVAMVAEKSDAKRVVIDSLPALEVMIKDSHEARRMLVETIYDLKEHNLTTLLVSEAPEDGAVSKWGVEEYITDGVIILHANETLDMRTLRIRKMRLTKHTLKPRTLEFIENGVRVSEVKGRK